LKPGHFSDFIVCSCWSSYLASRVRRCCRTNGGSESLHVLDQRSGVDDPGDPQRAPEGAATFRSHKTGKVGMQVRAPTRPTACLVGLENDRVGPALHGDNP
jgi:hypothetical protein